MSFRVVVVSKSAKLELKINHLVIRDLETIKIHISEIAVLMVESTAVSLTSSLLCELVKHLLKSGFMMMQESAYCKLALNQTVADGIVKALRKNKPPSGVIQTICITEKQFERMEFIVGDHKSDVLDTDERLVII